ncbi:MAG: aspartate/glutamate racemase family protein [Marinobacter sp.]|uniref:aspartate/glutamate racemase family protein n=1 Tax=Marinobacter sp. TaxID=50741 RepID=UPI00299D364D|nr:aspartate/glutamate racemase family protein [Marinobacter sp.]MDX1636256.1 aspartate/glutamate racemase family protein [Marinobacter sp.]
MKTIGLLGGMSWESTQTYYRLLNEQVKARLGGLHSAKIVLYSVDFAEIEALQRSGEWDRAGATLALAALALERAGADFLVIGTNTMHKVATEVEAAIGIPLLHIADATAKVLHQDGIRKVGLLGTRFTMEQAFYRERLEAAGIEVVIPEPAERDMVHRVIFEELCLGIIEPSSRQAYLEVVDGFARQGAEAVVLGCTEVGLLVQQAQTTVRLYDTTAIHAAQAVDWALRPD